MRIIATVIGLCTGIALALLCLWYGEVESLWLVRREFLSGDYRGTHGQLIVAVIRSVVQELGNACRFPGRGARYVAQARHRLGTAGNPHDLTVEELWGWRIILALIGGETLYLVNRNVILALLTAYLWGRLPCVWLTHRANLREADIRRTLPGVLDLLVICTGAGLTFDAAVNVMIQRSPANPLVDEFRQVLHHMRMGDSRREALRRMAARCRQPDVRSVCSTLVQADELGTSISSTLLMLAGQVRLSQSHRAEARANRAPVQMLFPLILFIFPSLLLVLFGPVFLGGAV